MMILLHSLLASAQKLSKMIYKLDKKPIDEKG